MTEAQLDDTTELDETRAQCTGLVLDCAELHLCVQSSSIRERSRVFRALA